jgi:hypothetical protein
MAAKKFWQLPVVQDKDSSSLFKTTQKIILKTGEKEHQILDGSTKIGAA